MVRSDRDLVEEPVLHTKSCMQDPVLEEKLHKT